MSVVSLYVPVASRPVNCCDCFAIFVANLNMARKARSPVLYGTHRFTEYIPRFSITSTHKSYELRVWEWWKNME